MDIKSKWNKRYEIERETTINSLLMRFIDSVPRKERALDIACGLGKNALYMAQRGFSVDAVDISDVALTRFEHQNIHKFCLDINQFVFKEEEYDLIFCANFLEREIFSKIITALKPCGILIYETFHYRSQMNPKYVLQKNELIEKFLPLDIIYYAMQQEKAELVAQKRGGE